jgi:hypothetical protein
MSTYAELLKHPEWQRKRLEVLQVANWTCEQCGAKDKTLHVHHGYYERGLAPWEYPDETLHCLCETCHTAAQEMLTQVHRIIGRLPMYQLCVVYGFALGVNAIGKPDEPLPVTASVFPDEAAGGLASAWEADDRKILQHISEGKELTLRDVISYRKDKVAG